MKNFILLLTTLLSFNALGATKSQVSILGDQYFLQQMQANSHTSLLQKSLDNLCDDRPNSKPCIDYACDKIYCGVEANALKVARACAGNYGDECVKAGCDKIYCGVEANLLKVVNSCKYNYGSDCIKYACDKIYCGVEANLFNVINSCKGADVGCVESLCSKVYCGIQEKLLSVINTCAGRD